MARDESGHLVSTRITEETREDVLRKFQSSVESKIQQLRTVKKQPKKDQGESKDEPENRLIFIQIPLEEKERPVVYRSYSQAQAESCCSANEFQFRSASVKGISLGRVVDGDDMGKAEPIDFSRFKGIDPTIPIRVVYVSWAIIETPTSQTPEMLDLLLTDMMKPIEELKQKGHEFGQYNLLKTLPLKKFTEDDFNKLFQHLAKYPGNNPKLQFKELTDIKHPKIKEVVTKNIKDKNELKLSFKTNQGTEVSFTLVKVE